MKIIYINHYAGSPQMGMAFRPYYLSREWVRAGHDVTIIAADFSHLRKQNPDVGNDFQQENIDGIRYVWIKTRRYSGNGVARAMTMFEFVSKLYKNAELIAVGLEPDLIITSSTYPADTFAGQKIQQVCQKINGTRPRLVHEVHDMWPLSPVLLGGMSKYNPFIVAMQIAEDSAYRHSDYVVSLLPNAEPYMKEHGLADGKFVTIPNGVDVSEWTDPEPAPQGHVKAIEKARERGDRIVGYFGGHALSNALDSILDCADVLKDEKVRFFFVGDGVEKPRLVSRAQEKHIDNAVFLDSVPKKAVPQLMGLCDVLCLNWHETPLSRFGISMNKVYDYMMAGKPIVAGLPAGVVPIECEGLRVVRPDDPQAMAREILAFLGMDSGQLEKIGAEEKSIINENFTYNKLAEKFLNSVMDQEGNR